MNVPSTDISGANDTHSRSVEVIVCNKGQCRILDINNPNNNLLICSKHILSTKFNTTKHTAKETTNSNTNQQLHK